MKKKVVLVLSMILFLCIFTLLNMISIYFFSMPLSPVAITGRAVDTGIIQLYIEGSAEVIHILFPLNTTYDDTIYTCSNAGSHPKCDDYRYILDLNVTVDFLLEAVDPWKYSLYDLEHGVYIEEDTVFTPNTTFSAVRWGNRLTVYANKEDVGWQSREVTFTVDVPDSSPILGAIDEKIFVCESSQMGSTTTYSFNASDVDEETLTGSISPQNPFYINPDGTSGYNISLFQIVSLPLVKAHVGNYNETISVTDPTLLADTFVTNISVIEINNAPVMAGLGAQTVWVAGADSTFSHQMVVTDVENGDSADGNLTFNLTWGSGENLFDINSSTGVMNYSPSVGHEGSESLTYSLTVCVNDSALATGHENFSICSDEGFSNESISICDSFTLTVTNENRAPEIVNYTPLDSNFSVGGTTATVFGATVSDDDMIVGYPDLNWYVNGVLKESNENISSDTYSFTAGCGVSGDYNLTVVTSDGLLSDSQSWDVTVTSVACPVQEDGGGAGGGGGGILLGYCRERWVCDDWQVCQNVERSFIAQVLSPEDYFGLKELCFQNEYDDRFCGFQITDCRDLSLCNNTVPLVPQPPEMRVCYFTEDPNCIDGITNCHDGACELLVDCGGPCEPCPTCSDGIQNQGEEGKDCGGPCPYACEAEEAFGGISYMIIGLLVVGAAIVIFILIKVFGIIWYHFFAGKKRKKKRKL